MQVSESFFFTHTKDKDKENLVPAKVGTVIVSDCPVLANIENYCM